MPMQKLGFKPGIDRMRSQTAGEGGFYDSNRIRFRQGLPEKMRGWAKYLAAPFQGVIRSVLLFYQLAGDFMVGVATNNHLYLIRGGTQYDITPIDRSLAVNAGSIATSALSPIVTATTVALHGLAIGDFVTFDSFTGLLRTPSGITVGGIALSGDYVVTSVPSTTSFTVTAASAATSTATSAGAATVICYLPAGPADATPGLGWGAGPYGQGAFGMPSTVAANTLPARMWSLDAWGQSLLGVPLQSRLVAWSPDVNGNVAARAAYVSAAADSAVTSVSISAGGSGYTSAPVVTFGAAPAGGRIATGIAIIAAGAVTGVTITDGGTGYLTPPTVSFSGGAGTGAVASSGLATIFSGPPLRIGGMCVGMPERHCVLFGCSDLASAANYDPMLVRFSNVEDYSTYQATATNSAGSFRLQGGAQIVGWLNSTLQTLIWTDLSLWTMRFIGAPYFYSFNKADANCGLIAQNARADLGGVTYWMSQSGFWMFRGGAPEQLVCTMQDTVFDALNRQQQSKVVCGSNTLNGEVIWFYPTGSENDRYIIYNTRENLWYGGALGRTAWLDHGPSSLPLGADPNGWLYTHETGTDADGQPMGEYLVSGYADLDGGESLMFVSQLIPDFQNLSGTVKLTVTVTDYPTRKPRTLGPFTITPGTQSVPFRARGRQMALRFDGGDLGSNWRLGALRANVQPDGTR